ncbi:MAG: hypothetical protein Q7S12_00885 [bacterium]|nr:hypothetical protein [bacterium]
MAWELWPVLSPVFFLVANRSGEFQESAAALLGEEATMLYAATAPNAARLAPILNSTKKALSLNAALSDTSLTNRGAIASKLNAELKIRKEAMYNLLDQDSATVFAALMPKDFIAILPQEVRGNVEESVSLVGQLEVVHIDDFNGKNSYFKYFLRTPTERFQFYPVGASLESSANASVTVEGFKLNNKIIAAAAVNTIKISQSNAAPSSDTIGEQKTLFLLVDFQNSPPRPFTTAEAKALILDGGMQKFYQEASYGKISWGGDVAGWYTAPRSIGNGGYAEFPQFGGDTYDPDGIMPYLRSQGIDLKQYDRLVILAHHPYLGGGFAGVGKWGATIDGVQHMMSVAWIGGLSYYDNGMGRPFPWTWLDYVLSHELGHNLGVVHANSWDCGADVRVASKCLHTEYGNNFDVMGTGSFSLHFNAFFKDVFGWANTLIINKSGTYTINPIENSGGVQGAKIVSPYSLNQPARIYVEYRKPIGFDATLQAKEFASSIKGLFVNWNPTPTGWLPFSRLLDLSPHNIPAYGNGWYEDWIDVALLKLGSLVKLTDTELGVTLGPIVSSDDVGITFKVNITKPICIRRGPGVDTQIWTSTDGGGKGAPTQVIDSNVFAGESAWINLAIQNRDNTPCSFSNFQVSAGAPLGWNAQVSYGGPIMIEPQLFGWNSIQVNVPQIAIPNKKYPVNITIQNTVSKIKKRITVNFMVLPKTPTIISPNGGENWILGKTNTIKWNGGYAFDTVQLAIVPGPGNTAPAQIIGAYPNRGTADWIIPKTIKRGSYLMRICNYFDPYCVNADFSNKPFNIAGQ